MPRGKSAPATAKRARASKADSGKSKGSAHSSSHPSKSAKKKRKLSATESKSADSGAETEEDEATKQARRAARKEASRLKSNARARERRAEKKLAKRRKKDPHAETGDANDKRKGGLKKSTKANRNIIKAIRNSHKRNCFTYAGTRRQIAMILGEINQDMGGNVNRISSEAVELARVYLEQRGTHLGHVARALVALPKGITIRPLTLQLAAEVDRICFAGGCKALNLPGTINMVTHEKY